MKILFCLTSFGFLRNFQSTVSLLAERGHRVHLLADRGDSTGGPQMVEALVAAHPTITYEIQPPPKSGLWFTFSNVVRLTLDYWRYLEPRFQSAVQLRARAERQVPWLSRAVVRGPLFSNRLWRRTLTTVLRRIERVIPPRPDVMAAIQREAPDVMLLTPLLYFGSPQVAHVRAARRLGIPTVLGVGSWDHLTTKGRIHEMPDRVVVWNELQRDEAVELHDVPRDRITVTGAQAYDHWFDRRAATTRDEFCGRAGLAADLPYLLYLCSSPFIAPREVDFVRQWMAAVRRSPSAEHRSVGMLVRPHPQNAAQWADVDLAEFGNAAIWPRAGANPIDATAKSDYFDSIFHSCAVVGVNTSGLIEAGIIGRRVYSVTAAEFTATQEGTLHFQHLKNVEGGLLRLSSSFDEHVSQLANALAARASGDDEKVRGFVKAFVRPYGLDVAATPRIVATIEDAAHQHPAAQADSLGRRFGRVLMVPVAFALMMATTDRGRWRSLTIKAISPARHVARRGVTLSIEASRSVRRRSRMFVRTAIGQARGAVRHAWQLIRGASSAD